MSSMYLAPRQPIRVQSPPKKLAAWFDFLPHDAGQRLFAGGAGSLAAGRRMLRTFHPAATDTDRSLIDALLIAALILLTHVTVIDRFRRPPEPAAPKKQLVQIDLIKPVPPPPPPPPPEVKPKPPTPPKPVAQPKPKPVAQPKPKPSPVATRPAPPVLADVPFADNAPPVEAPPAPPPKPASKVVQVTEADYLRPPEPEYPEDAQERGLEGKVLVKARILPSGEPDDVQVQKSSGHASLDRAAVQAVQASLFRPNMEDDTATTVWAVIPITFQL